MEKKLYFDKPTQVLWYDVDADEWKTGIAYCDEIICACCGGIQSIEEVYEFCPEYIMQPIHEYEHWIDLTYEIMGDGTPETFIIEVERVDSNEE